jgi:hypothetical protein
MLIYTHCLRLAGTAHQQRFTFCLKSAYAGKTVC